MLQLTLIFSAGSDYLHDLLDHMNKLGQVAVGAKIDILKMMLRCFQLDSLTKNMFREVGGFGVLISMLASLYGSLTDNRELLWSGGVCVYVCMIRYHTILTHLEESSLSMHNSSILYNHTTYATP